MSMVLHVAPPSSMEVTGVETAKSGRLTFSDSVTGSSRMRLNHSWPLPPPSLSHKTTGVYLIAGAIANCLFRLPPGTRAFGGGQNHLPRASTALWANMCTSCPSTSIGPNLYSLMHSSGRSTFRKRWPPRMEGSQMYLQSSCCACLCLDPATWVTGQQTPRCPRHCHVPAPRSPEVSLKLQEKGTVLGREKPR